METFKGATSPTSIWKYLGCNITHQYMEIFGVQHHPPVKLHINFDNNNENGKWPLCRSMDILSY
jgi:hypothetical protein